eukprot:3592408-Pleurochrysis_carterae.AAC.1
MTRSSAGDECMRGARLCRQRLSRECASARAGALTLHTPRAEITRGSRAGPCDRERALHVAESSQTGFQRRGSGVERVSENAFQQCVAAAIRAPGVKLSDAGHAVAWRLQTDERALQRVFSLWVAK